MGMTTVHCGWAAGTARLQHLWTAEQCHVLLRSAGISAHPSATAAQGEIEDLIPFNSSLVLREWPEGGSRATCVCSTLARKQGQRCWPMQPVPMPQPFQWN